MGGRSKDRGEKTARKRVGGVTPAGDVPSDDVTICAYELRYKSLEEVVDVPVPAAPTVPSFNDPLVVTIDEKGRPRLNDAEKSMGE